LADLIDLGTTTNIPSAPMPASTQTLVFPSDLTSITSSPTQGQGTLAVGGSNTVTGSSNSTGGYYSAFTFVPSSAVLGAGAAAPITGGGGATLGLGGTTGSIYLPLPLKIHDVELNVWQDASYLDYIPSIMQAAAQGASSLNQQAINPFLYMLYKQPLFREFTFQWILAPNNAQESQTLYQILSAFKTAALPTFNTGGNFLLNYPYMVRVQLNPNTFMFDILPCVIISVEVDYSGSGHAPSFFKDGAPTIISFTLHLKEAQIFTRNMIINRGGVGTVAQALT
jgi:hypothetical protein